MKKILIALLLILLLGIVMLGFIAFVKNKKTPGKTQKARIENVNSIVVPPDPPPILTQPAVQGGPGVRVKENL